MSPKLLELSGASVERNLLGLCLYSLKKKKKNKQCSLITIRAKLPRNGEKSFDKSSKSNRRQTGLVKDCLMLSKVLTRARTTKEPRIS